MDKSLPAKMLLIVFRDSLEDEVVEVLQTLEVKAFTELRKVDGMGEAGAAFRSLAWPGGNAMILAALSEAHADRVVKGLRAFRDKCLHQQQGKKVPLRVFVLPCLEAV